MRRKRWHIAAFALAITILVSPSYAASCSARAGSQSLDAKSAAPPDAIGHWHGFWAAPGGWSYEFDMQIHAGLADNITADITWTLRAAPAAQADMQPKIGMSGVEHTKGTFLPGCGAVKMDGVSLNDPNKILGIDKYRLILSDD